jgi:thiamine-monophosphate kinase
MSEPTDEFDWIASLRPLTLGDRRALDLADDAAIIPSRAGWDLVVSDDAMVSGIHFLVGESPDIVARRLLRTSLSDLAAKAAEPFGYLLMVAWPTDLDRNWRAAFAAGLAEDGARFGVALLGGDTVSTPGPLTASVTVLGWTPRGRTVKRSTARAGDVLMVCGSIGDGWLGLRAAKGEIADASGALAARYRLPMPLLGLREALLSFAGACADVSDGLLADAGHIAAASGIGVAVDTGLLPLSPEALAWLSGETDVVAARLGLSAGGDDYALACAVSPANETLFAQAVTAAGTQVATVGQFQIRAGLEVRCNGLAVKVSRTGWRHR